MVLFISHKQYLIGEVLKHIFFRNPGIAKVLAVERDVKPPKYQLCKGIQGAINREGAFVRINMVGKLDIRLYMHIFFYLPPGFSPGGRF